MCSEFLAGKLRLDILRNQGILPKLACAVIVQMQIRSLQVLTNWRAAHW